MFFLVKASFADEPDTDNRRSVDRRNPGPAGAAACFVSGGAVATGGGEPAVACSDAAVAAGESDGGVAEIAELSLEL